MSDTCLREQGSSLILSMCLRLLGYVGKMNMSQLGWDFCKDDDLICFWNSWNVVIAMSLNFLCKFPYLKYCLTSCLLLLHVVVADILLWRHKKQTLTTVFILAAIYFNFIAPGYTVVTAVSKLLLVVSIFLFVHGILPEKVYAFYFFWTWNKLVYLTKNL